MAGRSYHHFSFLAYLLIKVVKINYIEHDIGLSTNIWLKDIYNVAPQVISVCIKQKFMLHILFISEFLVIVLINDARKAKKQIDAGRHEEY